MRIHVFCVLHQHPSMCSIQNDIYFRILCCCCPAIHQNNVEFSGYPYECSIFICRRSSCSMLGADVARHHTFTASTSQQHLNFCSIAVHRQKGILACKPSTSLGLTRVVLRSISLWKDPTVDVAHCLTSLIWLKSEQLISKNK